MSQEIADIQEEQRAHAEASRRTPLLGRRDAGPGIIAQFRRHVDSFRNFVTGSGVRGRDRITANQITPPYLLSFPELAAGYIGDGLIKRITKMPAEDAVRAGWDFDGDPEGRIVRVMNLLEVKQRFGEALQWTRLYGGALTVLLWDDGRPLNSPFRFNPEKPQRLVGLRTHSAAEIWILPKDLDNNPRSIRYELPEYFTVRRVNGPPYEVHHTRVIEWRGNPTPDRIYPGMDIYRRYWGFGDIQAAFDSLSAMGISWNAVSNLMQESVIGKYKLKTLKQLLLAKDYAAIEQRMMNIELSKNYLKGVMLGDDEEYTRDALEFAGVADVLDRLMMRISADVNIPVSLLFGRGAAGMNATGEGDARQYYDSVEAIQDQKLRNHLELLARWIGAVVVPEADPATISAVFRPCWSMSEKEAAETRYKTSQADALDKVNGILSPLEIRRARYGGRYSTYSSIPAADVEAVPPDPFMLQLGIPSGGVVVPAGEGGSEELPESGTHSGGLTAPHATASEVAVVPQVNLKEQTKVRSTPERLRQRGQKGGPGTGRQSQGVSQPGATTVHAPTAGNRTKGDRFDALRRVILDHPDDDEAIQEVLMSFFDTEEG